MMNRTKFFIMIILSMFAGLSFAQTKRSVNKAKSIASKAIPAIWKARDLIQEALVFPRLKDDAATWNVAGFIEQRFSEEQMKKAVLGEPYDTLGMYNSILTMYEYYLICDKLAQQPNKKGKIKNKFRKRNARSMLAERPNLINGGVTCFNADKDKEALKFFATYIESAGYPILEDEELVKKDTLLPQVAYYAVLAADRVGDTDAVIQYAPTAFKDKEGGLVARQLMAGAYKSQGDTLGWIETMEEGAREYPVDYYFFTNLVNYYISSKQVAKAMNLVDDVLTNVPDNKFYLYVKAFLYYHMEEYDKTIEFCKKAIKLDPEYAEAYSNVGLAYLAKAQALADKSTIDINSSEYRNANEEILKFYKEAMPFYEKARTIKPEQKDLWLNGLYKIYYYLKMEVEFEEIDKLIK